MRRFGFGCAGVLLATTMLSGVVSFVPTGALAQSAAERRHEFRVPSQPVPQALNAIGRVAGLSVVVSGGVGSGVRSQPVSGTFTVREALSAALAGTGLSFSFTNGNTVTVFDPGAGAQTGAYAAGGDAIQLETIDVTSGGVSPQDAPYETPGSVSYISEEQIQQFRGTSPGDIFKNAPGVLVGENHNSGAVDVNIRGMQGVGRVPVTVDGALNTTTVYRGYQGVSSRTFIDPDFIGGIDITKGPSFGAGGAGAIGGLVAMRTINADDILLDGKSVGAKVRAGFGTNTTDPVLNKRQQMQPFDTGFTSGDIERPDWFEPTSGFGSAVLAGKNENAEFVAGWSRRKSGNYHAGENGDSVAKDTGPHTICDAWGCNSTPHYYPEAGLTRFLGGEEVLNTSQDTTSILLKGTVRGGDGHMLEIGFNHSDSKFGENYPAGLSGTGGTDVYQGILATSDLNSYTARYRWDPSDNDAVDFRWNAFHTSLVEYSKQSASGLTGVGKWVDIYGTDVSNKSIFDTAFGAVAFEAGGSYVTEETGPTPDSDWFIPPPRQGERWEASAFSQVKWAATDWLTLDGGLRYQRYRTEDKLSIPSYRAAPREGDSIGYSAGATITPIEGVQLFGSYKDASRLPSLLESSGGFLLTVDPRLGPETAHNWEFGINVLKDDLAAEGDRTAIKAAFFDNTIDDYVSRRWTGSLLILENIHKAHFQGFELSGRHETNFGFTAELAGTYYTDVTFCRTADTCANTSLASDYGTNYVPPEYQISLTLTQKLLDDALTFGGRVSHTGPRAAGAETPASGALPLIAMIDWDPYTLVDLFAEYKVNENVSLDLSVENVGDIYYVEPLSLALIPAPGRTIRAGLTARF